MDECTFLSTIVTYEVAILEFLQHVGVGVPAEDIPVEPLTDLDGLAGFHGRVDRS